jgi:hypothetical protein
MKKKLLVIKVLIFSVLLNPDASAQADRSVSLDIRNDHPRLMLLKGEETGLIESIRRDPVWSKMHQAILSESDRMIGLEPLKRIQIGRRLLDKSREALGRMFFLSYAYRTTQDPRYLKRAEKEMLNIAGFSDWNPSHFLDVAEMTMALSIGYDWLYEKLPVSSRDSIRNAIIRKGIEPSLDSKNNGWLKAEHNWNQVCNAGISFGAIAVYENEPELAKTIIARAIESIKLPMKDYGPDGIYPEGYGYWGYGTSFNVLFLDAIEKLYKTDFGLSQAPGFLKTAGFMENMTGPTGIPFNYSDAGSKGGFHPAMFWIANRVNDPSLLWAELKYLKKEDAGNLVKDRLLPAIMLWKGNISADRINAPAEKTWVGKGKNPIAMMRTSWTDSKAIYIAAKGGSASINHAHMDIGSFVMDANGERWAMDFGSQNYESLESKGVKLWGRTQDSERWDVFRLNNFSHNTLTVDSQLQLVSGHAPIIGQRSDEKFMQVTFDLSSVYKTSLRSCKRGIAIVNKKEVQIRDELETGDKAATIRWNMLTAARVEITGPNSAVLSIGEKTLKLTVSGVKNIRMKTWSTDPPRSYDAPNPGTILVGFEALVPASSKADMLVTLLPVATK